MNMIKQGTLLSIVLLVGCASSEVKQAAPKTTPNMNDAQLKTLLVGKTMIGDNWSVVLNSDGSAIGKSSNSNSNDKGLYTLQNGLYCSKWKSWGNGNKRCWSISKRSKGYYGKGVSGGAESFRFTMK